jgi:hypothetical protein
MKLLRTVPSCQWAPRHGSMLHCGPMMMTNNQWSWCALTRRCAATITSGSSHIARCTASTTASPHMVHAAQLRQTVEVLCAQIHCYVCLQAVRCPEPGAVIGLHLSEAGLVGTLPASLGLLPLQLLDVSGNPYLHGAVPLELANTNLRALDIAGTRISCHGGALSDEEAVDFAQRLHSVPFSAWPALAAESEAQAMCLAALGSTFPHWGITQPSASQICDMRFFPGSTALVPPDYLLAHGCLCRGRTWKVFSSKDGVFSMVCQSFQYIWIVETLAFCITVVYAAFVLHSVVAERRAAFVNRVKLRVPPGTLHFEGTVRLFRTCQWHVSWPGARFEDCGGPGAGLSVTVVVARSVAAMIAALCNASRDKLGWLQSVSWRVGFVGLLRARCLPLSRNAREPVHQCFVAMCTVKHLDTLEHELPDRELTQSLKQYCTIVESSVRAFKGWTFVSGDPLRLDRSRLVFGFHQLADAVAWALHTQSQLLHAPWPAFLAETRSAHPIWHAGPERQWRKIFSGLRVAIAINKQVLSEAVQVVRTWCTSILLTQLYWRYVVHMECCRAAAVGAGCRPKCVGLLRTLSAQRLECGIFALAFGDHVAGSAGKGRGPRAEPRHGGPRAAAAQERAMPGCH